MKLIIILLLILVIFYLNQNDDLNKQINKSVDKTANDLKFIKNKVTNTSEYILNTAINSGDKIKDSLSTGIQILEKDINIGSEIIKSSVNKIDLSPFFLFLANIVKLIVDSVGFTYKTNKSIDNNIPINQTSYKQYPSTNNIVSEQYSVTSNIESEQYSVTSNIESEQYSAISNIESEQYSAISNIESEQYPATYNMMSEQYPEMEVRSEKCTIPILYDYLNNSKEGFSNLNDIISQSSTLSDTSFKKIIPNNLYYGLDCKYIKNDSFYDALKELGFKSVDGKNTTIIDASLIVPCSYETTEKEIEDLEENGIKNNKYGNAVRIFMLNNTDYMVSKLSLWKYLTNKFCENVASTMIPYTWDLTTEEGINKFKKDFNPRKIYITKNNKQRQEGIQIHSELDSILNIKDKLLVQELLQNPYTVRGRKINLRVYVLVIKDSFNNFKALVYRDGFMYYTPEYFEKNSTDEKKNITTGYIDRKVYEENPLTHEDFRKYLDSSRELTPIETYIKQSKPNVKLSDYIFSQIYHLLAYIFETFNNTLGTKTYGVSFQLYGVDVAIDDELRPQIMEINKGPDLTAKDGRDKNLKIKLCKDMLKSVGLVNNDSSNNFINVMEKVNIDGKIYYINDFSN